MKTNQTSLSVKELQKTIGQWKKRKITDSTEAKLLELYLGMTAYMNEERVYPVENFYDISLGLRFKNTRFMTEAIKQCGSFGVIPEQNVYGMKAFYSLLWKKEMPQDEVPGKTAGTLPRTLPGKFPTDDIYNNIYPKGETTDETIPPVSDSEKKPSAEELSATVKDFFHLINETPAQKEQIFTPLINWFQLHEKLTRTHACDNLVYLVNELLTPYFSGQARFQKSNHIGRLCWLSNLLKSPHGQHLLNDAARSGRQKREQELHEKWKNQRDNRPLSEFEWTDLETGLRFYDDEVEGAVDIPQDAPPRPSETAVWNVLSHYWIHNS